MAEQSLARDTQDTQGSRLQDDRKDLAARAAVHAWSMEQHGLIVRDLEALHERLEGLDFRQEQAREREHEQGMER